VQPGFDRLSYYRIPGGQAISKLTESLTSPKMLALVEELNHRVPLQVVMSDRPSLLRMADVVAFSCDRDALLQVVEQGKTTAEDVQRASSLVNDSRPVLRIVLNWAGPLAATSARISHDGSSRNRAVATRDRRAEPRGREAYLKQYVDRLSGEPACLDAGPTASRCVATALARSSALCMIVARRENTTLDSDFRFRDCSRSVHE